VAQWIDKKSVPALFLAGALVHHVMAQFAIRNFAESPPQPTPSRVWSIGSAAASLTAFTVSVISFLIHGADLGHGALIFALALLCVVAVFHARFLQMAKEQYCQSNELLFGKEREYQSIFENALDAILVVDDKGVCREANPSAHELFDSRRDRVVGHQVRMFYSDPQGFDSMWTLLLESHKYQGEAELIRSNGATVFAEFTAAAHFLPNRHLMIFRDITLRRRAQQAVNQSLVLARSSWQEAEALRRATLALTEDLRMDRVLDTLLQTLARFVPYQQAQLLLLETGSRLFVAREAAPNGESTRERGFPEALEVSEFPILVRLFQSQEGLLVEDTLHEKDWRLLAKKSSVRSWIGVPINSSNQTLGILSLSHSCPASFSYNHLQLTRALATPAVVAIQNARLYERAEIYGAELEHRIAELHRVERTLEKSEQGRRASADRFQKVFQSVPIAISVTSLAEGVFIEVNETFERCCGLARTELLGRSSTELGFWENPQERARLVEQLRGGARVHDAVARLKSKSGHYEPTLFSAEVIDLDGQACLLVVIEDPPRCPPNVCN
jgi:PAS domain S-box-containing protein